MYERIKQKGEADVMALFGISIMVWLVAAWLTHVIVCIGQEAWGLLIAGAILFPIGVIHGTGVWFGAF